MEISANQAAKLIIMNLDCYSEEKDKEYSRVRISKDTMYRIAKRERLREAFVNDLSDELYNLGWHLITHSDTEFAIIETERVSRWAKISSQRISDFLDHPEEIDSEWDKFSARCNHEDGNGNSA
ncbi:hypothetical protein [Ferrovum sp.]|uniref:hypothetical protein n=1 Tax=Ferrovum sp. TaxID=2609467 RepID=UPI002614D825|nr:hypothetical protein [Ferrovum sp.]